MQQSLEIDFSRKVVQNTATVEPRYITNGQHHPASNCTKEMMENIKNNKVLGYNNNKTLKDFQCYIEVPLHMFRKSQN